MAKNKIPERNLTIEEFRAEQIQNWIKENTLGFKLWETKVIYNNGIENITLRLQQWQCKHGIYILQVNEKDNSFLTYKAESDICQKTSV